MTALFPISLDLADRPVLVAGGGKVALRKVKLLLEARARVTVVSPRFGPDLHKLEGVELRRRAFRPSDLEGCTLAIAATDRPEVNEQICREARRRGVLVNVVDRPELCDFHVPASVRRGRLCLAISTGGASPSLARRLRRQFEQQLPAACEQFVELLADVRKLAMSRVHRERDRRKLFEELASPRMLRVLEEEGPQAARAAMLAKLERAAGSQ